MSAVASPPGMLDPGTSNWTVAYAMCPSADTWPGVVYGSLTPVTCAACRKGVSARVTRACTAGEVTAAPDRMASVSVSPDRAAKCSFSNA